MNFNKGKEIINKDQNPKKNLTNDKKDMRKRLMRIILIFVGILVVFLVVLLIISLINGKNMDYEEIEQEMKNAAMEYYDVQKGLLPK